MNILLGISGGIAAYKTPEIIRLLCKQGHEVKTVVTEGALQFVTELTLQTVSGHRVYSDMFSTANPHSTEHISLPDWADCMLIAPATANVIAKTACGIADDALTTTYVAFDKPVYIAPAMNNRMYAHPTTQENLEVLRSRGVQIIDAETGFLACGTEGKGRMAEPSVIVNRVVEGMTNQPLKGCRILITAGPTYERIDPVRFIGNFSTGKMGFALAEACAARGAEVTLVAGPVSLQVHHPNIERIDVTTAEEMYTAATSRFATSDGAILCAAVADFTPRQVATSKLKRKGDDLTITLQPTRDIAAALGQQKTGKQFLVGFALETDHEEQNAEDKMKRKNFDFIVLNSLRDPGAGFGYDTNKITIISADGTSQQYPLKTKQQAASDIVEAVAKLTSGR